MAYQLPETASLESLTEYAGGVAAGLQALALDPAVSGQWLEHRKTLKTARDLRDDARFELRCASAVVQVRDAQWDKAVGDLSGHAFLAAGKKADAEPYATLFGATKAAEAQKLGPEGAAHFGHGLVAKGQALGVDGLAKQLHDVAHATADLEEAGQLRVAAEQAAGLHEIERKKLHAATEALIATTEATILAKLPGRNDLVRAVLAPERAPAKVPTPGA